MILTCPECSTRYMAKDGTIGPNGRSVKCARCDSVWFVSGTDPDALALQDNETVLIEAEQESDPQADLPFEAPIPAPSTIGAHVLLRDKADAEKLSKRMRLIRSIWAVPLICVLGAGAWAYLKRQTIVDQHPKAATLYQAIGLNVKTGGLDIDQVRSETLLVDGRPVLRVTGQVKNLRRTAQIVPLIEMRLENRSGETVADWFVEIGQIAGDAVVDIETDYPAPPVDGVELRYRFVAE